MISRRIIVVFSAASIAIAMPLAAFGGTTASTTELRLHDLERVERVYHDHRIGATRAFEQAVPVEVLERKLQRRMLESVVVERTGGPTIDGAVLEREWRRIVCASSS